MSGFLIISSALLLPTSASADRTKSKPTIFIIGDSTLRKGSGEGDGGLWDQGDSFYLNIDTTMVSINIHAIGGRTNTE